jgi:hypothetical protein
MHTFYTVFFFLPIESVHASAVNKYRLIIIDIYCCTATNVGLRK